MLIVTEKNDIRDFLRAGGDGLYLIFRFIQEQDGQQFLAGGSAGLRRFLFWYEEIKASGNQEILELYLWKFVPFLPESTRLIVLDRFGRRGGRWEAEHSLEALRFRTKPSEDEISAPAPEYRRWTTSPREAGDDPVPPRDALSLSSEVLLLMLGVSSLLIVRWPILKTLGNAYPPLVHALPAFMYDVLAAWSLFYLSFLFTATVAAGAFSAISIMMNGQRRWPVEWFHPKNLLRHCLIWISGPFHLFMFGYAYHFARQIHRDRIASFHINMFKVHLVSLGVSLAGFDSEAEKLDFMRRFEAEYNGQKNAIFTAAGSYLLILAMLWLSFILGLLINVL